MLISRSLKLLTSRNALFISTVWPERTSSAAGVRTSDLISALRRASWKISYLSPARPNHHSEELSEQCRVFHCPANREAALTNALAEVNPALCIFDRFLAEEAFSFRVRALAPGALRVLDLQDLHFLRRGRENALRAGASLPEVLQHRPGPTNDALRELAAIHRSDLALVCSPVELEMLQSRYQVPACKLQLAPFFVDLPDGETPPFSARQHFMTIGNFRHAPNLDSVKWLADELWGKIRALVPCGTELHIYGAYGGASAVQELHAPERGLHIKGHAPSLGVMDEYRVCLAPLRFGAGLKGKIVDSWLHGMPVVTTPIGAEGMFAEGLSDDDCAEWGGLWQAEAADSFAQDAARLYADEQAFNRCRAAGRRLLGQNYNRDQNLAAILSTLEDSLQQIEQRREDDFLGNMLWMQNVRSTEYFSRWIELKETQKQQATQITSP